MIKVTFWGVYESDYPRNRIFIEGLKQNKDVQVNTLHSPVFEKTKDKSGAYLSFFSLLILGIKLKLAYFRLIFQYFKIRKNTDIWVCGYIGQMDVIVLSTMKKLFRDRRPLLFNPLVSMHDTLIGDRQKFDEKSFAARMLHKIDKRAFSRADHIIIDTMAHKDFLCKTFDIPFEKVSVIWVGAESSFFRPGVKMPRITQKPFIVQFVGKFIPLHGIDIILDSAKWFKEEDVIFEVIGSGQLEDWFKTAVEERNLTNIRHIPWVPYEELPEKMRKSHLSLGIFSTNEKALRVIPNKVFQALALGRITITAQSKGIDELTSCGIPVIAVKPGSGEDLARMIQMVKNGYRDMEGFARQAKKLSKENFSPDIICGQFKEICRKLIAGEEVLPQVEVKEDFASGDESEQKQESQQDDHTNEDTLERDITTDEETPSQGSESTFVIDDSGISPTIEKSIPIAENPIPDVEEKEIKVKPKTSQKSSKKKTPAKKTKATKNTQKPVKPVTEKKTTAAKKPAKKKTKPKRKSSKQK